MRELSEVICPACHEPIDLSIDIDAGSRTYVEECPICDEPMRVRVRVNDEDEFTVKVQPAPREEAVDEDAEPALVEETEVTCPACWETVSMTIDLSAGSQTYSEDCSVCCRPMTVRVWVSEDGGEHTVDVEAESD